MTRRYVMHKESGMVGVADLPDFVSFDEQPPRSFDVRWWNGSGAVSRANTEFTIPITKEVYDIMRGV
jgi:hypothetical protein